MVTLIWSMSRHEKRLITPVFPPTGAARSAGKTQKQNTEPSRAAWRPTAQTQRDEGNDPSGRNGDENSTEENKS